MMLPPDSSLPLDGFTFFIAAEACLTARKHLVLIVSYHYQIWPRITYESALILIFSMNSAAEMSARSFIVATPAFKER